ncbi:Hypothetical predicted protein [Paramuricea clavata]|uniref:Uncharacterized protein n=1 Tax=Paramuricea clavata TaxID=317549 RepID=A0A7D9D8G6_PARCT|nr:Hypothetical predicted protein [Paramuricea clavata]
MKFSTNVDLLILNDFRYKGIAGNFWERNKWFIKNMTRNAKKDLASNLSQLHELQANPFGFDINELDDGSGIATLTVNKACWHKSCRNKINTAEVKRVAKRKEDKDEDNDSIKSVAKMRSLTEDKSIFESGCFFCDKPGGNLRRASTLEVDTKVRKYATKLNDTSLLTKLAAGDMVAIDAIYHTKCIVAFYNRVRWNHSKTNEEQENSRLHAIAFAELGCT